VERLYSADESEPPSALDLLKAGTRGLKRLNSAAMRDRGYAYKGSGGTRAVPSFWRYWVSPGAAGPEEATVDRAALAQIMARLTPVQAGALLALAEHGSHQTAADALGVPVSTFESRLDRARSAFLVLWHEHEVPSRKRRDKQEFRRPVRSEPASRADEIVTLTAIAGAFGGQTRVSGRDLLAALAAADPGRYRGWDPVDLSCFLHRHRVSRHRLDFFDGPGRTGRRVSRRAYWLEEVTAALDDLTAGTVPAEQTAA
jgi:hypothetical protein